MKKSHLLQLFLMLAVLLTTPVFAAQYQKYDRQLDQRYDERNVRDGISRQQAADIAQQEHPGRVLGVKRKDRNYRVKTLNRRGELRETRINSRNGKIIRERRKER